MGAKTGQTKAPFNSLSNGGSIESHGNAAHQAKEAKSQEGPRRGSKAGEKAEEAKRAERYCRISEKRTRLTVLKDLRRFKSVENERARFSAD